MTKYFSKNWRQDSFIGNWYGVAMNRLGLRLLKLGRKMIGKGGGTFRGKYYSNCSWCGDGGDYSGGLHHSYSRKGSRCTIVHKRCDLQD